MIEPLPEGRAKIKIEGDLVELSYSAKINPLFWGMFFVGFLLSTLVLLSALASYLHGNQMPLAGLLFLIVFQSTFMLIVAWQHLGREKISVTNTQITVRKEILNMGISRTASLNRVHSLKFRRDLSADTDTFYGSEPRYVGFSSGPISFSDSKRVIKFGNYLEEAEALMIYKLLNKTISGLSRRIS